MLPVFAAEIVDQNKRLKEMGMQQVNLTSVIMGMLLAFCFIPFFLSQVPSKGTDL
jgi:hypothetical protein